MIIIKWMIRTIIKKDSSTYKSKGIYVGTVSTNPDVINKHRLYENDMA